MYRVLIPQRITQPGIDYLQENGCEIKWGRGRTVQDICADVEDCDAILARTDSFNRQVIDSGKKLKVIARHGIGVDNIDVDYAAQKGIWVTNAPLSNSNSVAEHVLYLILACAKNGPLIDRKTREGIYETRNAVCNQELEGKILGIIGLGRIGKMVAQKARLGFGMKVIAYDPFLPGDAALEDVQLLPDKEEVFRQSDFVTLHLPATADTRKSIGMECFRLMKPTAYLINAARGEVVDEAALADALKQKLIAGAGIDVFDPEPPKADNPLFTMEQVVLSPHMAATTNEAMDRMGLHAAMEIVEVLQGRKPRWPVNRPDFERKDK